jgi:hypothetical protein
MKEIYATTLVFLIATAVVSGNYSTNLKNVRGGNPFHLDDSVYQCMKLYEVDSDEVQHEANKLDTLSSTKRARQLPSTWDSRYMETM